MTKPKGALAESSFDYRRYVVENVQKGLDQLDRGEYLTHEQAKAELRKWVS